MRFQKPTDRPLALPGAIDIRRVNKPHPRVICGLQNFLRHAVIPRPPPPPAKLPATKANFSPGKTVVGKSANVHGFLIPDPMQAGYARELDDP
jgi:hypothetical protein